MNVSEVIELFLKTYGEADQPIRMFAAPGRVELLGGHTDYNGGKILAAPLSLRSLVAVRERLDRMIRLKATDLPNIVEASYDDLQSHRTDPWGNYQLGVANELLERGFHLAGCDMLFDETVPIGSGLSSSAAIEVATAMALMALCQYPHEKLDLVDIAKVCQKAEHDFIGVQCGIMDQFTSAMGKKGHAIALNCKDLSYRYVPLHLDGFCLVISNTMKRRSLAGIKYNERRAECDRGLSRLQTAMPTASCLGDISAEQFERYRHLITDDTVERRVRHVVYENERVVKSVHALENGDLEAFGKLMSQSHMSEQFLYEVSCSELDTLVETAVQVPGVLGSRMTGAGFGGCTVSIVKDESVQLFMQRVGDTYHHRFGIMPEFYLSQIGDGTREISHV